MDWQTLLLEKWHVFFVGIVLIVGAWIDGKQLKVPNWLTYPFVFTGLAYSLIAGASTPEGWSFAGAWGGWSSGLAGGLWGMVVGLLCLLPLYSVGGMGAGDVKLMAGVGAWLGWYTTVYAFCVTTIVGAALAIAMVLYRGTFWHHYANCLMILREWMEVRNPWELSRLAAERKPKMALLPYGIPMCIGSLGYFAYAMYAGLI